MTIQNINQPHIKLKIDFRKPKMEQVNVKWYKYDYSFLFVSPDFIKITPKY